MKSNKPKYTNDELMRAIRLYCLCVSISMLEDCVMDGNFIGARISLNAVEQFYKEWKSI